MRTRRPGLTRSRAEPPPHSTPICRATVPGAHAAEARQRIAALDEQARKDADEKAWGDAVQAGTSTAFKAILRNTVPARMPWRRASELPRSTEQARKDADEKAWNEAVRADTTAAISAVCPEFRLGRARR